MSRLRDFGESFGLVRKVVSVLFGGGVTAGSTGSVTTDFFFRALEGMDSGRCGGFGNKEDNRPEGPWPARGMRGCGDCGPKWRTRQPGQRRACSAEKSDRRENLENRKAGETGLCRLRPCFPAFQIYLFYRPNGTLLYRGSGICRRRLLPSAKTSPRTDGESATRRSTTLQRTVPHFQSHPDSQMARSGPPGGREADVRRGSQPLPSVVWAGTVPRRGNHPGKVRDGFFPPAPAQAAGQSPPKRRWRRAYSSRASKSWAFRKSGQSVGVTTNSA